jgi:hypothetical protein
MREKGKMPVEEADERKKECATRGGKDPPASHVDNELVEEPKSPYRPSLEEPKPTDTCRPDPPAMQVLIGDMLHKLDPSDEIQSNDLSNWVLETLHPATRQIPRRSVAAMPHGPNVSPSELDNTLPSRPTRPPPGQQTVPNPWNQDELVQNFEEMSNLWNQDEIENFEEKWKDAVNFVQFQNFEEKWKDAVNFVQSVVGTPPPPGPPDDPVNQVAMSHASDR